ncbi:prepilin peptidase [Alteromonas sp. 5E99-2]|uniref:prepilin peptidase n=1 Tax=Alteromonas sp. 5E99-2 TaxID=2817683 RepID=UPI001A99D9E9|nr:A24 family peptidase [Alteromonas sp. 5E99-2]MBO1256436.1 prepilin peptidase [Alteromonas sp. 5E99-2]
MTSFDVFFDTFFSVPWFFYSVIIVVSLMVGSFLNVVIYRLPIMMERSFKYECNAYFNADENEAANAKNVAAPQDTFNLAKPDSTCPHCKHAIRAWENIPVVSYLFLKGKCSQCKSPISVRYPLVELTTALLSLWVAYFFGPGYAALAAVLVTWFLIAMSGIDLDTMYLPDQLTLPLLWFGLALSLAGDNGLFISPSDAILGAIFGYLSLWSIYWLFKLITGKEGMGYGDFKLLAALGAFTGWQGLPIIILLSSLVGAVVGITIIVTQNKDKNLQIPYGPYLAAAGWLTLMYAQPITDLYFSYVFGV